MAPKPAAATTTTAKPTTAQTTNRNCNIKGNISKKGEKIYHIPDQAHYNATKIDTSAGERWLYSEAEAKAVGWRKSKN